MKTLIALALTMTLSQAFANSPENQTGSPAQTGTATGTYGSEAPPSNDTTGAYESDTVRSNQSSTARGSDHAKLNRNRTNRSNRSERRGVAPENCVTTAGITYQPSDEGYSACRKGLKN